jgi:hypothetical protein
MFIAATVRSSTDSGSLPAWLAIAAIRVSSAPVRISPGSTTLTRMPCRPISLARPLL